MENIHPWDVQALVSELSEIKIKKKTLGKDHFKGDTEENITK